MIEQYTSHATGAPDEMKYCVIPSDKTVKRNSVIVLRVAPEHYDLEDLNTLQKYYQERFPNNQVCVMWNDIEIEIVHDHTFKKERPCAEAYSDTYY